MTVLRILQYPDLRLRNKGKEVKDVKAPRIQKIIKDMIETLKAQEGCAGLASTQLDIENPPSITVLNLPEEILCLVNPVIMAPEGSNIDYEGCMSVRPDEIKAKVKRATKIKVSALDKDGNQLFFDAEDFLARLIQHECDHLKGVLYVDHIPKSELDEIDKKIAEPVPG